MYWKTKNFLNKKWLQDVTNVSPLVVMSKDSKQCAAFVMQPVKSHMLQDCEVEACICNQRSW